MKLWKEFVNDVQCEAYKIGRSNIPFFRGQNDPWELVPSLFWKNKEKSEACLYFDFLSYSAPLFRINHLPWIYYLK